MDLRDSKSRIILIVVALGAALVIAVASCGGGGGDGGDDAQGSGTDSEAPAGEDGDDDESTEEADPSSDAEPQEPLAEVTGSQDITLTVTRAQRETGGFLTVEGELHNGGQERLFALDWAGPERELMENGFSMAGASLVAPEEGKKYLILRDTDGRCLCTGFEALTPGDTVSWYAQFPAPEASTTEVQFQIGDLPAAAIEIQ